MRNPTLRLGASAGGPDAGSSPVSIDPGAPVKRSGTRLLRWRGRASEGWSGGQPVTRTSDKTLSGLLTLDKPEQIAALRGAAIRYFFGYVSEC